MPILQGDIKLKKTQVMADTPDGGGAPTGIAIADGANNAVFPDVSEMDRALGRVKLRKLALHVDTANADMLLGANIIVAEPPDDPNISITLFNTKAFFDRRTDAVSRLESYLNVGPQYAGVLYGNHIAGQSTILLYQKTDVLPVKGATMVLTKREGYGDQFVQYVRVVDASATLQNFEDGSGVYQRYRVEIELLNVLEADFPGFDVQRFDYTKAQLAAATKISSTVVANAARYYGVSALALAAALGSYTVQAASAFTQLVPSAQIETPVADARTNQIADAVLSSGGATVQTITGIWSPANSLFIGGALAPNSLSVVRGAITVTDAGGRLMSAGSQVGTVDYANGVLALTVDLFGSSAGTHTVTSSLAAVPPSVTVSLGIPVTAESRSLNYVRTLTPKPAAGTLLVSYLAQGNWYELRDLGNGEVRGSETAYGAGMLNLNTGTVTLTLGALPDAGSEVILQWVEDAAVRSTETLTLENDGKLYWIINTSGTNADEPGGKAIEPGALSLTWPDGANTRTVTDNSAGGLAGYGTGTVDYARGIVKLSPTTLPPKGTSVTVDITAGTLASATAPVSSGAGNVGATNVTPGSVSMTVQAQPKVLYGPDIVSAGGPAGFLITDDGAGGLRIYVRGLWIACGSIDYATGDFELLSGAVFSSPAAMVGAFAFMDFYERTNTPAFTLDTTA